jgi:hypothetical protein
MGQCPPLPFWTMTGSSVLFSNSLLTYHPTIRCYKNCTAETVEIHGVSKRLVQTTGLPHTKIRTEDYNNIHMQTV